MGAALSAIRSKVQHDVDSLESWFYGIDISYVCPEHTLLRQAIYAATGQRAQLVPLFQGGSQGSTDDSVQSRYKQFDFFRHRSYLRETLI